MPTSKLLPLFSALTLVGAWDWSFFSTMVQATQVQLQVDVGPPPLRIAIIGAGAGGSSAGRCYDISTQIDMTNRDCRKSILD